MYEKRTTEGRFGTVAQPVIVPSGRDARIAGCIGGHGRDHEVVWFNVPKGKKCVCCSCMQVFQLGDVQGNPHPIEKVQCDDDPQPPTATPEVIAAMKEMDQLYEEEEKQQ